MFNKKRIACHYVKTWFLFDFISVFPFFLVTQSYDDPFGKNKLAAADIAELSEENQAALSRSLVLLRIFKLVRMVKLARVAKASHIMQRVLLDFVMNQWEWTYAVLKMFKLLVILCFFAHWQACVWGLVSSYMLSLIHI